jgi:glycerol uptake facilitator-like aquaporin
MSHHYDHDDITLEAAPSRPSLQPSRQLPQVISISPNSSFKPPSIAKSATHTLYQHDALPILAPCHDTPKEWLQEVDPSLWRAVLMETVLMMLFTYLSLSISITAQSLELSAVVVAGLHVVVVAFLIMAAGSVSGAHFNPNITLTLFFARKISALQTVLYVGGQVAGASLGGLLVRVASAQQVPMNMLCTAGEVGVGSVLVNDIVGNWTFLFVVLYVACDTLQSKQYGRVWSAWSVGAMVGLWVLGNASLQQGMGGASLNPARCFGISVATLSWSGTWLYWTSGVVAAFVNAVLYRIASPN